MDPVHIERVAVSGGRMHIFVRVSPGVPRTTTPDMAKRALRMCPTISHHSCINNKGPTFAAVMGNTSIPHLLEHLIIDFQVRNAGTLTEKPFVGTTQWRDKTGGTAHVEVNFYDDLIAFESLKQAVATLNDLLDAREQR